MSVYVTIVCLKCPLNAVSVLQPVSSLTTRTTKYILAFKMFCYLMVTVELFAAHRNRLNILNYPTAPIMYGATLGTGVCVFST